MKTRITIYLMLLFLFSMFNGYSTNPDISKYLKNLSASLNSKPIDDRGSEIVVEGNIVHIIWVETQSDNYIYPMFYCRSTDLGKTWQNPVLIGPLNNANYASSAHSRKLAVDGNTVHIAYCDYKYSENGTGRIYYYRSLDNGSSFEPSKIVATTGGGYNTIYRSMIKAAAGKVAIAYIGEGPKSGVWVLHSNNGGTSFTDTQVHLHYLNNNELGDFYFDGKQMIILHDHRYYSYGFAAGYVYVTVSNDNGGTATTNKLSFSYQSGNYTYEKCAVYQQTNYGHFARKIGKSGNNIHVVFGGATETSVWTILYARSTDNGITFEKAVDMNNGEISGDKIDQGSETILANNGNVYIAYSHSSNPVYFCYSDNNGNSYSKPQRITPSGVDHVSGTFFISLVNDPTDASGKSFYLTGNKMFSAKSKDGGKSFSKFSLAFPFLKGINDKWINAHMACDDKGGLHWISEAKFALATDYDVFYRHILKEPEPGNENTSLNIKNVKNSPETETVLVPSSSTLNFDSAMTAEAWVKFAAGNEVDLSILAKINGGDGSDYSPSGYNMGFRVQSNGKLCINSGIKTDKGDFINWGDCSIFDTLWHHIAFTYDANGGLNNYQTYVDGILSAQQTVTGKITSNEGLLLIGARGAFSSNNYNQNYYIDEVRLWNKALSQPELIENQIKKFTGVEEGLKLYFNFDDTFKDISGNGNDGIPVYNGNMFKSDFDPPISQFDMYQNSNQVAFHNKTVNGKTYLWTMGDGTTLEQGNPVYSYTKSGEYKVFLNSKNSNSTTITFRDVTIVGVDHVEPVLAGNSGFATISVFGGGLGVINTTFILRKSNETDITAINLWSPANGQLTGHFNLNGKTKGKWDVIVKQNAKEYIIEEAFSIIQATLPDPWISILGRGQILYNTWQTYTINYGNNGNVDALGVPVNIAITNFPETEVELIDFKIQPNEYMKNTYPEILTELKTDYFISKDYFGAGKDARIYPMVVPVIAGISSKSIHIRIKSPASFEIESWTNQPYFVTKSKSEVDGAQNEMKPNDDWPDENTKLNACVALSAMHAASGVAFDLVGLVLPVGCAYNFFTGIWNPYDAVKPKHDQSEIFSSSLYGYSSIVLSCANELSPFFAVNVGVKTFQLLQGIYEGYKANEDCHKAFDPNYKNRKGILAVFSFDPNEMIGPSGFSNSNYIRKNKLIPYTILFENKSTASAPAHGVTIRDTLDLNTFDLTDFGFSSFGWGDTVFILKGNKLKEFSRDIDLRPAQNLVARVSGKLDTITGVVKWEFISLNPTTMDYEEDPFIGFLPPNDTSRAGEGFVSFSVGIRKELKTNDVLKNKASIVFDANQPILTNEYINTLDIDTPESIVLPLPSNNKNHFELSWAGNDVGSGIAYYDVYVMENDTSLRVWKSRTTLGSAEFIGNLGSQYKFYSIATDNVSLDEENPTGYDAETTITVNVQEFDNKKGNILIWPNPANNNLNIQFTDAPSGVYVLETINSTGNTILSKLYTDADVKRGVNINIKEYTPGLYFLRIVYQNRSETLKFIVQ